MNINRSLEKIRDKWRLRFDADEESKEEEEEEEKPKYHGGGGHGNTRLPYGLCKGEGIDTTGMTPKQAWKAYEGETGISPKEAYEDHFGKKKSDSEEKKEKKKEVVAPKKISDRIKDAATKKHDIDSKIYDDRMKTLGKLYPGCGPKPFKEAGKMIRKKAKEGNEDAKAYLKRQKEYEQQKREAFKDIHASDCETMNDLREYAKQKYGAELKDEFESMDMDRAKEVFAGIDNGYEDCPEMDKVIKSFGTVYPDHTKYWGSGTYACSSSNGEIDFNMKFFGKEDMDKGIDEAVSKGHWPKNTSPASIANHEFAHQIEYFIVDNSDEYGSYDDGYFGIAMKHDAKDKHLAANHIVSEACKRVKKTEAGKGKKNAELIASVSGYATVNRAETMAEAFADCYANGDNANPLSKAIKEVALEKYRQVCDGMDKYS